MFIAFHLIGFNSTEFSGLTCLFLRKRFYLNLVTFAYSINFYTSLAPRRHLLPYRPDKGYHRRWLCTNPNQLHNYATSPITITTSYSAHPNQLCNHIGTVYSCSARKWSSKYSCFTITKSTNSASLHSCCPYQGGTFWSLSTIRFCVWCQWQVMIESCLIKLILICLQKAFSKQIQVHTVALIL